MRILAAFVRSVYYFFVEDGSIVIGAVIALIIVGILAVRQPFADAQAVAGPLLFLLVAGLLVANLLRVASQARPKA